MLFDGGTNSLHGLIVKNHFSTFRLLKATLNFLHGIFGVFESISQHDPQHLLRRSAGFLGQFFETQTMDFWNGDDGFQRNIPVAIEYAKFYLKAS